MTSSTWWCTYDARAMPKTEPRPRKRHCLVFALVFWWQSNRDSVADVTPKFFFIFLSIQRDSVFHAKLEMNKNYKTVTQNAEKRGLKTWKVIVRFKYYNDDDLTFLKMLAPCTSLWPCLGLTKQKDVFAISSSFYHHLKSITEKYLGINISQKRLLPIRGCSLTYHELWNFVNKAWFQVFLLAMNGGF